MVKRAVGPRRPRFQLRSPRGEAEARALPEAQRRRPGTRRGLRSGRCGHRGAFGARSPCPSPRERSRWLVLQVRSGRELHSRAARFPSPGLSLPAGSSEAGLCSAEPPPVGADRPCVISTNHQVPASTQAHSRAFVRAVGHEVSPCHRSVAVNTAQAPNNAHVTLVRRCLNIRLRYPGQCRSRRGNASGLR